MANYYDIYQPHGKVREITANLWQLSLFMVIYKGQSVILEDIDDLSDPDTIYVRIRVEDGNTGGRRPGPSRRFTYMGRKYYFYSDLIDLTPNGHVRVFVTLDHVTLNNKMTILNPGHVVIIEPGP